MASYSTRSTTTTIHHNLSVFFYKSHDRNGVICLVVAALVSLAAIFYLLVIKPPKPGSYRHTHLFGYIVSLLFANFLLSASTAMSLKWVIGKQVTLGAFCTAQGALKQAGNLATAVWTFILALHLFNLLFLRSSPSKVAFWITFAAGWSIVLVVVVIGPAVIHTRERGPYFGIAGPWCWINNQYPEEQIFLQYFFEFLAAGLSIILYLIIILRVRGNLVYTNEKWRLQYLRAWDGWRLAIGRDIIDTAMLRFAQSMVWFPVSFTILLLPVAIARITSFAGPKVPFGVIIFTDSLFNLIGLLNVLLLLSTRRFYPDMDLPEFNTPRNTAHQFFLMESGGVSPFTLNRSVSAESYRRQREAVLALRRGSSVTSTSNLTVNSNSTGHSTTGLTTGNQNLGGSLSAGLSRSNAGLGRREDGYPYPYPYSPRAGGRTPTTPGSGRFEQVRRVERAMLRS